MGKKARNKLAKSMTIDVACVIFGDKFDWSYVEKLYRGVTNNLTPHVRFHVYTEAERPVPEHMIRHNLAIWPSIAQKRNSGWWYKMQLFNNQYHTGQMLYFDLDTVITGNLDWIWQDCSTDYFWSIRDFKHLFRKKSQTINSSIMWFDTERYRWIWEQFSNSNLAEIVRKYHGDQDYITAVLQNDRVRHFPPTKVQSYRWQLKEGGWDFDRRCHLRPGDPTVLGDTSVVIFHGKPKPDQVKDSVILTHWA